MADTKAPLPPKKILSATPQPLHPQSRWSGSFLPGVPLPPGKSSSQLDSGRVQDCFDFHKGCVCFSNCSSLEFMWEPEWSTQLTVIFSSSPMKASKRPWPPGKSPYATQHTCSCVVTHLIRLGQSSGNTTILYSGLTHLVHYCPAHA